MNTESAKIALVTGAANRIGATIARQLATAGYAVIIHYRASADAAETLAAAIREQDGAAATVQADLADRAQRRTLIGKASEPFGPLTVLVNNASLFIADSVDTLDEDLWDRHFAVHAEAPAFLTRDFAVQLPQGVQGNVVNMIDERILRLNPSFFSYTLSKQVLWTATRTMAQTLAPRVRVNAIGPGPTLANDQQTQKEFEDSIKALPLQEGPDPEDIAEAVLFLLKSRSITGQMLALDGGEHLIWREKSGPTPRRT